MLLKYTTERIKNFKVESLVLFVPVFDRIRNNSLKELDAASLGGIKTLLKSEEFTGKEGEVASIFHPRGYQAKRVILVGVGDAKKLTPDSFRRAAGTVSRFRGLTGSKAAVFCLGNSVDERFFQAAIEGYLLGSFELLDFKSGEAKRSKNKLSRITFAVEDRARVKDVRTAVERGRIIAEGQLLVRRSAFTPSNHLTPRMLAREARQLARKHKFNCRILDEKAIAKEKMGGLLGVAKGSAEPPRFIVLRYRGGRTRQKPIVLAGKGVTFDSGGISLKDRLNMHEMKGDMAGAAAVLATFVTAARLKLPLNLAGLIPATENMPSGTATKPGDILTTRKGLTVEIINTDAEGRLILADALDYANKLNPQAVIDIATLTGASLYILGYAGAPILGNNDRLLQRVKEASEATAEKVWELPIWDDHREMMRSPIADLINSAGRPAGTIAASAFLENFVGNWPWVHIDIAYMDLESKGKPYTPKGPTGFGLRLLIELLSRWKKLS
jgi:leucyl aminopeptidase